MKSVAFLLFAAAPSLVACSALIGLEEGQLGCDGGAASADDGQNPCGSPDAAAPQTTTAASSTASSSGSGAGGGASGGAGGGASGGAGGGGPGCVAPAYEDPATHHCYEKRSEGTWQSSVDGCEAQGGYLASITSKAEIDFVAQHEEAPVWIGGSALGSPMTFTWSNGEPWSYAPWVNGGPGKPKGAHCVTLRPMPPGFALDDCGAKMPGLCERSPTGM